ncbi:MAG: hypothetical protein IJY23_01110 [Clostridia bacterium]|nr:hypothetical protein [Clostridia bacterium]
MTITKIVCDICRQESKVEKVTVPILRKAYTFNEKTGKPTGISKEVHISEIEVCSSCKEKLTVISHWNTDLLKYKFIADDTEARWKGAGFGDYYCSICGSQKSEQTSYCPDCGARMAVSQNEI